MLSGDDALALGCLGYVARASGVRTDARLDHPTTSLPVAEVEQHRRRCAGPLHGATRRVRGIGGPGRATSSNHTPGRCNSPRRLPATGAARSGVGIVEGWRGTVVHRVEIDDDGRFTRAKIVDPSWFNWPALPVAMADTIVPDFPLANKSFNQSYAGNDL